jgi:holo-[acyl-carrier protein] synthase
VIIGTGIDLCEVARMRAKTDDPAGGFLAKVFLPAEIAYCQSKRFPAEHFAARFAAKEAVSKALQVSEVEGSLWLDIEIHRETDGRPEIRLHGRARMLADQAGVRRVLVSLSHTRELALAMVVLED